MKVDDVDEKILGMLKENARMAYVDIAKEVGLSEGAVRRRVEKLVKGGIIERFTISARRAGYVTAFVLVRTDPAVPTSNIVKEIAKMDGVRDLSEVAGPYEIAFLLEETGIDTLNEGIETIRSLKGVIDTSSFMVLKRH
ncbi:MAG: AsnC family transcriptional regulator [Candidatus Bathyarchaeia archaeon]